jgi:hypothetical protein
VRLFGNAILEVASETKMKRILKVPSFSDAKESISARLLFLLSIGLAAFSILLVIITALASPLLFPLVIFYAAVVVPLCVIVILLVRASRLTIAGTLMVAVLWTATTFGTISAGAVSAPIFIGYVFVIAVSGLITSRRVGIILTALTILTGILITTLETQGRLPEPVLHSPVERISIYSFFVTTQALKT